MSNQVKAVKKIAEIKQKLTSAEVLAAKASYEVETGHYMEGLELLYWMERELDEVAYCLSMTRLYLCHKCKPEGEGIEQSN